MSRIQLLTAVWSFALATLAGAQLALPALFTDHAVLQRGRPIPVWGRAAPGATIRARLGDESRSATAGPGGDWRVLFASRDPGEPLELVVTSDRGDGEVRIRDLLVGEVWICSGQSNMEWPIHRSNDGAEVAAAAGNATGVVRLFAVPRRAAAEPVTDVKGRWSLATERTVLSFSAVGYHFGRTLAAHLRVPVGLIHTSWGGTRCEAWTRVDALARSAEFAPILVRQRQLVDAYPTRRREFEEKVAAWKAAGSKGRRPAAPTGPIHRHGPGQLFAGMIAPIVPYAMRGVIWYQGESNARRAEQYRTLFPTMIRDWRDAWRQGDFPFLFVQLANYQARLDNPAESRWAELREAQAMALRQRATGMATAIDIGEARDIHPRDKKTVGERLARAARAIAYGETVAHRGPTFDRVERRSSRLTIRFTDCDRIVLRGPTDHSFQVAGADRIWRWAGVEAVDDDPVSLSVGHPAVVDPLHVRYAWANNPIACVYDRHGLPAPPFRSDDWPGLTAGER